MGRFFRLFKHSVILIILALIVGFASYYDVARGLDQSLSDYVVTNISAPARNDNIYVIDIDSASLKEIGPWPWSRAVMGDVINTLCADPENAPAVIGVDVMYIGNREDDPDGDDYLVEAAKNAGNVVFASEAVFGEEIDKKELDEKGEVKYNYFKVDKIDEPFEQLKAVSKSGFINNLPDKSDEKVRKAFQKLSFNGKDYYSFADEIYSVYAKKHNLPERRNIKLDNRNQWNIEYCSSCEDGLYGYGTYSLSRVLSGEIPASEFKDGIVLIGPYSTGMEDGYYTPISPNKLFGVDIHANIVQCLLENRIKHEAPRGIETMLLLVLMVLLYIAFKKLNIKLSTVIMLVSVIALIVGAYFIYRAGLVISVFYPLLAIVILYASCLISNYIIEILRRKNITSNFKKYVAPQVVENIIKGGLQELKLGGSKRDIAALFVDIRGFTPMSEKLNPEQVVEILNDYLNLTSTSIFKFGGTLDKFIGDATMAIFNAPLDLDNYVFKAVCTALEMRKGADRLKETMIEKFGTAVSFGIGINCGPAVVGNIGATFRMEYTAIGDTVNTAARLESNAKPGQILISEAVYEKVKHRVMVTPIGEIPLKGKSKGVFVYQLDNLIEEAVQTTNEALTEI